MEFKSKTYGKSLTETWYKKNFHFPFPPTSKWKLESSHRFIKDCAWKVSVGDVLEWDQLLPYAIAAFNCFPNEHSQESPYLLYFGFDPYLTHLAAFLQPKVRYLGSDEGMIHLNKLRQVYMLAALNMREVHSKQTKQRYDDAPSYKIGYLVMIKNFDKKSTWDAKYIPNFRVVCLIGSSQLEVSDPMGRTRKVNVCDSHQVVPSDHNINSSPDQQVFGRRGKYMKDPRIIKEVVIIDTFLH